MNWHPRIVHCSAIAVPLLFGQLCAAQSNESDALQSHAKAALAQHSGAIKLPGVHHPVEILRDRWGVPHIYARDTHDLFYAQGFTAAQDHMWQMEMWRRNGEGRLAEVLGPAYIERDKFARLLAFRGDWDAEFRNYHPEGKLIFSSFAEGVNAAIREALSSHKIPIEFDMMGFQPAPDWTARTALTRMPAWSLSRNASTELSRALAVKAAGVEAAQKVFYTSPHEDIHVPDGLDLNDIVPAILDITRGANDTQFNVAASGTKANAQIPTPSSPLLAAMPPVPADNDFDRGSNNWVVGNKRSATGMPLLANDPHREISNPALRMFVHLNAPGWNVLGVTEPGVPGIHSGHNDEIAWGSTTLGVDQQDIYVEETDPADPNRYLYKGVWKQMTHDSQTIAIHAQPASSLLYDAKSTIHGPVLYEDRVRHRAYALKWVGAQAGAAGYPGSLNLLQSKDWKQFTTGVGSSWYLSSNSLVYADRKGNYGYTSAALVPMRSNWDGLMPVPGKDGRYEWNGFLPYAQMPRSLNSPRGYYASANNDVIPKIVPEFKLSTGFEYSPAYRYDRITAMLDAKDKFSVRDFQTMQHDELSLPAQQLVPLLHNLHPAQPEVQQALDTLTHWDFVLAENSVAATIYEYWLLKLTPLAYAAHLAPALKGLPLRYDTRAVVGWMRQPDGSFGIHAEAERDHMLLQALDQAVAMLRAKLGADQSKWVWGNIHIAEIKHPLLNADNASIFGVEPQRRGGDAQTVHATSSATEKGATQESGASVMFIYDVSNWDNSVGMNTPGNESQPGSQHYADLAPKWGAGEYFPLTFSRGSVEKVTEERLILKPAP